MVDDSRSCRWDGGTGGIRVNDIESISSLSRIDSDGSSTVSFSELVMHYGANERVPNVKDENPSTNSSLDQSVSDQVAPTDILGFSFWSSHCGHNVQRISKPIRINIDHTKILIFNNNMALDAKEGQDTEHDIECVESPAERLLHYFIDTPGDQSDGKGASYSEVVSENSNEIKENDDTVFSPLNVSVDPIDGVDITAVSDGGKLSITENVVVLDTDQGRVVVNGDEEVCITDGLSEVVIDGENVTVYSNEKRRDSVENLRSNRYLSDVRPKELLYSSSINEVDNDGLFSQLEYYKSMYNILENKINSIWSQREAFRLATERMSETLAKQKMDVPSKRNVRFNDLTESESDDGKNATMTCRAAPTHAYNRRMSTVQNYKGYVSVREASRDFFNYEDGDLHPSKKDSGEILEKLLKSGKKLYAFRVSNSGIRTALYLDVGYTDSIHCGKVFVGSNIGLFKVSIIPNEYVSEDGIGSRVLNFFGLNGGDGTISNVFNTIADYSGISWFGSDEKESNSSNKKEDNSPPYIHIRYIHTLADECGKLNVLNNTLPKNSFISSIFNGKNDQMSCISSTKDLRRTELYGNKRFEFILKTTPTNGKDRGDSKRYNNTVYVINSTTKQYLCIDMLTHELKFDDDKITRAYSKYVVPVCFKLVPLQNILTETNIKRDGRNVVTERSTKNRDVGDIIKESATNLSDNIGTSTITYKGLTRKTSRFIDDYGNFAPGTSAAGTPAPSPRCKLITFNLDDSDAEVEEGPYKIRPNKREDRNKKVSFVNDKPEELRDGVDKSCAESHTKFVSAPQSTAKVQDNVKNLKLKFEKLTHR